MEREEVNFVVKKFNKTIKRADRLLKTINGYAADIKCQQVIPDDITSDCTEVLIYSGDLPNSIRQAIEINNCVKPIMSGYYISEDGKPPTAKIKVNKEVVLTDCWVLFKSNTVMAIAPITLASGGLEVDTPVLIKNTPLVIDAFKITI